MSDQNNHGESLNIEPPTITNTDQLGSFFFMPHPGMLPMGLISADYAEFDSSLTYAEISNHVCEQFRQSMREYCKEKGNAFPPVFEDNSHIIILWRNVVNLTGGKVELDKTLETLCEYKNFAGTIYIRSIQDVLSVGVEYLLHMIAILYKNHRSYIFLDNDYFSYQPEAEAEKQERIKASFDGKIDSLVAEAIQNVLRQTQQGEVISNLENLLQWPEPAPIDRFLEIYWKWQKAEVAVDVCKTELGITHRTFYKYSQIYEATPYYCEHLKIFYNEIKDIAKRGPLPDKEDYLRDMYALDLGQITPKDVCKKYELASVIDIPRVKIALTERRRKAR